MGDATTRSSSEWSMIKKADSRDIERPESSLVESSPQVPRGEGVNSSPRAGADSKQFRYGFQHGDSHPPPTLYNESMFILTGRERRGIGRETDE